MLVFSNLRENLGFVVAIGRWCAAMFCFDGEMCSLRSTMIYFVCRHGQFATTLNILLQDDRNLLATLEPS